MGPPMFLHTIKCHSAVIPMQDDSPHCRTFGLTSGADHSNRPGGCLRQSTEPDSPILRAGIGAAFTTALEYQLPFPLKEAEREASRRPGSDATHGVFSREEIAQQR